MDGNKDVDSRIVSSAFERGCVAGEHKYVPLLRRAEKTLDWMVADMKRRHDECGISPGNYSDELTEASNVLEELQGVNGSQSLQGVPGVDYL